MCNRLIKGIDYILTKGMKEGLAWLAPLQHMVDESTNTNVYIKDPSYKSAPGVDIKKEKTPKDVKHLVNVIGHIAYTELGKCNSIVSGAFSGCWMGKYYDGINFNVCHIDTTNGGECKKIFLNNLQYEEKCYFLPHKIISDVMYTEIIESQCKIHGYDFYYARDIFGIITSDNQFYSFIMGIYREKYYVVAWAEWEIYDKKQRLKRCLTQFEELYPCMIDPDSVISLEI